MAQPDLAVIAGTLRTLSDQVSLVPNIPGLGALEQRVADLDHRVGTFDNRVGALDQRLVVLDQRVGALDQRVIALDQRVTDNHQVLLETIRTNQRLILEQMQNNQEQMQKNHRDLSRQISQLQTEQNLHPLRLFNSGLSETAPLRYPSALFVGHPLPITRLELHGMPTNQCIQVATILELPPLPPGTVVAKRRRQIAEYLGAPSSY